MTWTSRGRSLFFLLVLAGGFFAVKGKAQVLFGTISGTVTDPSGAVIPNARISIKNNETGVTRASTTNARGAYSAPGLSPGPYTVSASATGFKTAVQSHVTLTVGANQVVNYVMQVGEATQSIQVTGAAATVNLISSTLSNVVTQTPIVQLPLNGRDWTQLAQLTAGVAPVLNQYLTPGNQTQRGNGVQISISGGRPSRNDYRLNGISINDFANTAPGSSLGENLGVDAIQEFSVLVGDYSAQFGRASGGIVNAITKAGTNQFHGDAYEFLRNDDLDAANFFTNSGSLTKPQFQRNQFGASAGGPIKKGRAFFFADYEGVRQNLGAASVADVLTASARTGDLTAADGGTVTVNPAIAQILPIYPLPNGALLSPDVGLFDFSGLQKSTENYVTSRLDDSISSKDSIFGAFLFDRANVTEPDNLNTYLFPASSENIDITLQETHIFSPTLINIARAGYTRAFAENGNYTDVFNPLLSDPSLGSIPGRDLAEITVSGITTLSGGVGGAGGPNLFYFNTFQGSDDVALTKGNHSLKFGASFERDQNNTAAPDDPNGDWSFGSIQDFLINDPRQLTGLLPISEPYLGIRQSIFGAYAQDDWRVRPRLTASLGLRYEMATVPSEAFGRTSGVIPLEAPAVTIGPLFKNPTLHDFSPRVGLAWDPFGNGKTSVRAGFGLYDDLPLQYMFANRIPRTPPYFQEGTAKNTGIGSFPAGGLALLTPNTFRTAYYEQNPDRPFVYHWDFNVQRQLRSNMVLSVAYMGERGIHLVRDSEDMDTVIPTITSAGLVFPLTSTSTKLNPNFGRIAASTFDNQSFYDALDAQLTQHLSHGVNFTAAYTWEKSIDYSSVGFSDNEFVNTIGNPYPLDMFLNRGVADYNLPQRFVFSGTWDVPTPSSWMGPAKAALGGWELGSIITIEDGEPFTAVLNSDQAGTKTSEVGAQQGGQRPNVIPGCDLSTGNPNDYINTACFTFPATGTLGDLARNAIEGPGLATWDFSLMKNIKISKLGEGGNLQFRAEFFNILNRANFADPGFTNFAIFNSKGQINANAGELTATDTPQREIQFGLKLMF
ncbi:MAG: TonB-dependent receptor domain-containing protein [Terriglobia bacterium]